MKLKTIISLIPEKPVNDIIEFTKKYEININHFKVSAWKETNSINEEQMNQILELLIDSRNSPIYIHCLDGGNVTSQVIMCLRKLQNYDMKSIFDEAKKYTEKISDDEKNFLKNYKGTIKVVEEENIQSWLYEPWWKSNSEMVHPTFNLIYSYKRKQKKEKIEKKVKKKYKILKSKKSI